MSKFFSNYKIIFSNQAVDVKRLNFYYNVSDVTVNIASNEGFGISWCESLHAGTPIINNVIGDAHLDRRD